MYQCMQSDTKVGACSDVCRSPPVRVVAVRVQKSKADDTLTTGDRYICDEKIVAKCHPRTILWQWPRHKDKN